MSPEEFPEIVLRRRAEEMAFNERRYSKFLLYARILIARLTHTRCGNDRDDTTAPDYAARLASRVPSAAVQVVLASAVHDTRTDEFAPRTSIPYFILDRVSYGRCPHDPGALWVGYPREARKARLPVQLEPDRVRQKRRKAPPARWFLKDDQQSRFQSASQRGWWPEEGRAVRSERSCKV